MWYTADDIFPTMPAPVVVPAPPTEVIGAREIIIDNLCPSAQDGEAVETGCSHVFAERMDTVVDEISRAPIPRSRRWHHDGRRNSWKDVVGGYYHIATTAGCRRSTHIIGAYLTRRSGELRLAAASRLPLTTPLAAPCRGAWRLAPAGRDSSHSYAGRFIASNGGISTQQLNIFATTQRHDAGFSPAITGSRRRKLHDRLPGSRH